MRRLRPVWWGCLGVLSACSANRVIEAPTGDSIVLEDGRRIIYIGVRAPTDPDWARRAREFNELHTLGLEVRLEYDQTRTAPDGSELAWVYLRAADVAEKNGRDPALYAEGWVQMNSTVVGAGMGLHELRAPQAQRARIDRLVEFERKAREQGWGLWSRGEDRGAVVITPGEAR